jgi:hypothetical protein
MSDGLTYAEIAEGVRATIAAYTLALDDGRTADVVATFCPDGICEIPGLGTHVGHDALREAYTGWEPKRPQRHMVLNTLVGGGSNDEATAVSDVILLLLGSAGWRIQLVGRYQDVLHYRDGSWFFHRRTASFVTDESPRKGTS